MNVGNHTRFHTRGDSVNQWSHHDTQHKNNIDGDLDLDLRLQSLKLVKHLISSVSNT